jgi:A/G-specific adenine glycosylase
MPPQVVLSNQAVPALLQWYQGNARALPWRSTTDPYAIWISEVMLQQTQVRTVIPYWERWMREFPDVASLARSDATRVLKLWEGLGYYTRARLLHRAAQAVVEKHGGIFPSGYDAVLALPGIGRYTAGAICSIAFNQPTPILDGNVTRVLARLFGIAGDPRAPRVNQRLWKKATELVEAAHNSGAPNACSHLNQALMELGAVICTPKQPECSVCPVRSLCVAFRTGRVGRLPTRRTRPKPTVRHCTAVVCHNGYARYLLRQRPSGVVNAHMWEFPNIERTDSEGDPCDLAKSCVGKRVESAELLCEFQHTITRYRIYLRAYTMALHKDHSIRNGAGEWRTLAEIEELALPSAHRKIFDAIKRRSKRE